MPFIAMVMLQIGYAGMMILSKLAMDAGLNPFVFVTYRQIFATIATYPFAFFLERKTRPRITLSVLFQIFLCSLTGVLGNQGLYFIGLDNSTPTIACALANILPAVTFLFAVLFRQETLGLRTIAGQAKVVGTLVCVGGAMLLSFYHGPEIGVGNSAIHWKYAEKMTDNKNNSANKVNFFLGPFLLLLSAAAWSLWFIIQARLSTTFSAPYTTTTLMCLMASVECAIVGACVEHDISAWSLNSGIKIIASLYSAIVCSALAFCVMSWCIKKKGALYVSVFTPLLLVITAILSWALLREKLNLGICLGSTLIIGGLYGVLWGKSKEAKQIGIINKDEIKPDLELQPNSRLNGDHHVHAEG
ncbi:hypothetical protein CRG98_003456 [Punica granatum]|nr:hypothetical protein CRG98_003456 [Punica granatum]